jgi:hypothetical protein
VNEIQEIKKMSFLETWLSSNLDEDNIVRICWMDGERFAEALASIDQAWFSKLRSGSHS